MSHQKLHIRHSILMGSKGKTMLKHANQYALYSGKVLCPTVLADIGSDFLKLANLMSVIDNALGRHERVDKATASRRLHEMGKIRKLGKWVLHELFENSIGRRPNICISLLVRQRKKNFLWKIVTGEEKWIMYDNIKHTHSWVDSGQPITSTEKKSFCTSGGTQSLCCFVNCLNQVTLLHKNARPSFSADHSELRLESSPARGGQRCRDQKVIESEEKYFDIFGGLESDDDEVGMSDGGDSTPEEPSDPINVY
uniref:DUF659 domain-containing protein n=1 Tax=Heterorhabditis bacteriophora TaxID=37862 RepID=A0A1I7X509_HETBA